MALMYIVTNTGNTMHYDSVENCSIYFHFRDITIGITSTEVVVLCKLRRCRFLYSSIPFISPLYSNVIQIWLFGQRSVYKNHDVITAYLSRHQSNDDVTCVSVTSLVSAACGVVRSARYHEGEVHQVTVTPGHHHPHSPGGSVMLPSHKVVPS